MGRILDLVKSVGRRLAKIGEYQLPNGWLFVDSVTGGSAGGSIPATPRSLLAEYQTGPYVYACISAIARDCAALPWHLKRVVKGGPDEIVSEHEIIKLFDRPMPHRTWFNLIEADVTYLSLAGKRFVEKVRKSKTSVPAGLAVMRPDVTRVKIDTDGVAGYEYFPNGYGLGKVQTFDPEDVVYQTYFNPMNPDDGIPPTLPAWLTIQMDRAATQWNWDFFRNGAVPDVLLSTDKVVPPAIMTQILTDFEQKNQNAKGRGRRAHMLPYGLKVDTMSASHREMQFERLIGQGIATMCAIFGVPPVRLGRETLNYATADKQLQMYLKYKLVPIMESVLRSYTIEVVEEWPDGEELYLSLDYEALKTDAERAVEAASVREDFALGIATLPEARAKRGYAVTEAVPGAAPEEREGRDIAPDVETEGVDSSGRGGSSGGKAPTPKSDATGSQPVEPAAKSADGARPRTPYQLAKARDKRTPAVEEAMRVAAAKRLTIQKARVLRLIQKRLAKQADDAALAHAGGNGTVRHDDE